MLLTRQCMCFFFFQAEDGIRDDLVTGVQTCALPICRARRVGGCGWGLPRRSPSGPGSEERREGKSVDLGGRRIIKKKKKKEKKERKQKQEQNQRRKKKKKKQNKQ